MDDLSHDIVIVGGGPSGIGIMYGLLSKYDGTRKTPNYTIALIDRGSIISCSKSTQDPKRWFEASHYSQSSSTLYITPPQRGLGNRKVLIPTARGVGGGTNINACMVARPVADDFNSWPDFWTEDVSMPTSTGEIQNERRNGSKLSRIMSSIVRIEDVMRNNKSLIQESMKKSNCALERGADILHVPSENASENDNGSFDFNLNDVTSSARVEECGGHSYVRRVNYFEGILEPLLLRNPKLKKCIYVYENTQVERLFFRKSQSDVHHVTGVECSCAINQSESTFFRIKANKKVILSAGAILSPTLLLVSGIGNKNDLLRENIKPLCDTNIWQNVGSNFQDHLTVAKVILTWPGFFPSYDTVNSIRGWLRIDILKKNRLYDEKVTLKESSNISSRILLKIVDGTSSTYIVPHVISSTFLRDFQIEWESWKVLSTFINRSLRTFYHISHSILLLVLGAQPVKWILSRFTAQVLVCLLNPRSNGRVQIRYKGKRSKNFNITNRLRNFDIIADPGYLSSLQDYERLEMGWKFLNTVKCEYLSGHLEILPRPLYLLFGSSYLRRYASDLSQPYYHWSGGCTLKTSIGGNNYVVDEDLKVRGVNNLHVCDASILPLPVSAPPALTLAGLGLTVAYILERDMTSKDV